jgi:hypothetical protein
VVVVTTLLSRGADAIVGVRGLGPGVQRPRS